MSAVVEQVGARALVRLAPRERDAGFVAARVVMTALYAGYVVVQLPSLLVPIAALLCGLAAVLVFDQRRGSWCAAGALVIAVLHARSLPGDAYGLVTQIGLAAFVVVSASASLVAPRADVKMRLRGVLALAGGLGCLVGAPVGVAAGTMALFGGLLAGMRPLSALEVITLDRTNDRWLAWTPLAQKGGR